MSFAIWKEKPPFKFAPEDREQIHQVGNVWVVTDDPARATQASVDAILNAIPTLPPPSEARQLADLLTAKGILTTADAATFEQGPAPVEVVAK